MRCTTLVLSATLFYSLSFVYAIPHDIDEKRHWLHRRQDPAGSSSLSIPTVANPSPSKDPQASSLPAVSSSQVQNSLTQASGPSSSLSSSVQNPTATPGSSSDLPSQSTSTSSGLTSTSSSTSTSTSTGTRTSPTPTPATTINQSNQTPTSYRRFSSTIDIPNGSQTDDGNSQTGTGAPTSFLKNKAAVGSTFAIVGLICAALISGAIFTLVKKLRQRKEREEFDTYFEKLPVTRGNNASNRDIGGGNDYGLGPSATDLTSPASTHAFMSRDVHFGSTSQFPNQHANYSGLEYPPDRGSVVERPGSFAAGTAYAAAMSQRGQYRYEGQVEDPNAVPNHPFADPNVRRY